MIIVDLVDMNKLVNLQSNKYEGLHRCLEELQLWKGENPMDAEAGVDYFSVFNKQKFLQNELTTVLNKYSGEFEATSIETIDYDEYTETIKASIIFTLPQNESVRITLDIVRGKL